VVNTIIERKKILAVFDKIYSVYLPERKKQYLTIHVIMPGRQG